MLASRAIRPIAGAALLFTAIFAHAQTLLVLEKNDKSMAIVDAASLKVVARVPAGEDPHEIVASDDGKYAYMSNYGAFGNPQHTLSVVDLTARKALPAIDLGSLIAPHGLEFENGKVYFTAEGSKVIGRYDPAAKRIDWTLGIGQNRTHMLIVSKDENRIYTSNVNSDSISILDRSKQGDASGWIETAIPVGKGPEGFDVSPDGKELWAANSHDGTISIIAPSSRSVTQTFETHTQAVNRLKFTPDGKFVLLSDLRSGDLVVLDATSHKEMKRISLGRGCAGILIVPDGSRAYVAVSPDNNIAIVDLKTFTVTARIPTGNGPDGMAWVATK
jgi:YVTN family beta-propeller protein